MARGNIDLSWLASLLTPTPTAANSVNSSYDPNQSIPYTDPVTGQTSGVMPDNTPFKSPSNWQRLVHPEQAGMIDTLNTQSVAKPISQNEDVLSELARRASVVSRRPSYMQTPGMTPDQAAASGQGDLSQSIPQITSNNANAIYAANGGAPLDAAALHNLATQQIEEARAGTMRAATGNVLGTPVTQAAAENAGAGTALQYNLGRQAVMPSEFGRQLAENRLGQASATGQLGLLPSRLSLESTQLGTQIPIAEEQQSELPWTTATMRAGAIRNLAETERMNIPPAATNMVNPNTGGITRMKDPLGANPFMLQFAGIQDLENQMSGKGMALKASDGSTYYVKGNGLFSGKEEYPLGAPIARPSVSGSSIGGGSNNVSGSVTHSTDGSMNPPTPSASSNTTLRPSMSSSIPLMSHVNDFNSIRTDTTTDVDQANKQRVWAKLNSGEALTDDERKHLLSVLSK